MKGLNRIRGSLISKKWLLLLLMTFSMMNFSDILTIEPAAAYTNQLINWDFESYPFTDWDGWSETKAQSTTAKSGSYSCALSGPSASGQYMGQYGSGYSLSSNSFTFGAWILDNVPGSVQVQMAQVRDTGTNTYYWGPSTASTTNSPTWQFLKATVSGVTAPNIEEFSVRVVLTADVSGAAPILVDQAYFCDTASFPAWGPPTITHPADLNYEVGTTGPINIAWTVTDDNPTTYSITRNAVTVVTPAAYASGTPINYDCSGLTEGTYTYVITAGDEDGLTVTDTVILTVNPPPSPEIVDLADVIYQEGTTQNWLNWDVSDPDSNPTTYTITVNGTEVVTDADWTTLTTISYNVDGLTAGTTTTYELTVTDGDALTDSDAVDVTVITPEYIDIDGDADFDAQAITNSWPGDGSSGSPYLLEDLSLTFGGNVPGISITNTESYFVINRSVFTNYATGIFLSKVTYGRVEKCSAASNGRGFWFDDCYYLEVVDNNATSNSECGFETYVSHYTDYTGNRAWSNGESGIKVENCIGTTVQDNFFHDNTQYGIALTSSAAPAIYVDNHLLNNTVYSNTLSGIEVNDTIGTEIIGNTVNLNTLDGIILRGCNDAFLYDNEISNNNAHGINLIDAYGGTVYWNYLGDNTGRGVYMDSDCEFNTVDHNYFNNNFASSVQGYDDGNNNTWYNETNSQGNLWYSNYANPYAIAGSAGSYDNYSLQHVNIASPGDFFMEYGDTDYDITWNLLISCPDNDPDYYTVTQNGTLIQTGGIAYGNWSSTVFVSLDGLEMGTHAFTVTAHTVAGFFSTYTVWVTVAPDIIVPVIDNPEDFTIEQGSIGYTITWSGYDMNPLRAVVLHNSVEIYNNSWIGEDITILLDTYSSTFGVHTFVCILIDWSDNRVNDTVVITVIIPVPDETAPEVPVLAPYEYVHGTTGHVLAWDAQDDHPKAYEWYLNGTNMGYFPWHGGYINISIDNLAIGLWNVTLTVYDISNNDTTVTVMVTVIPIPPDFTAPLISTPAPIGTYENTPGSIIWEVSDDYPGTYAVYQDGTIVRQGMWTTGIIQYTFLNLSAGEYVFNLTIWDLSFNMASSTVTVTVQAGSAGEIIAPDIAHVPDITVTFGTTGNNITFMVFDQHPGTVEVLLNGARIYYSPWLSPDQEVMVSLDGLGIGSHNVTLVAEDIFGNIASRSVAVTVEGDDTPPVVNSPDSLIITTASTVVEWTVSDDNLASYEIYLLDTGVLLSSASLAGKTADTIIYTIAGYEEGEYTFRIIVYDTAGHRTIDDVNAIVEAGAQPSPGFEFITLLMVLIAVVVPQRIKKIKGNK